ncbi:hypothetical protein A2U01_0069956, partial [Trifolium medium]|nr:hypothetical protein [Trifolium medium]
MLAQRAVATQSEASSPSLA